MEANGRNRDDPDRYDVRYKATPGTQFEHLLETKGGRIDCTCGHAAASHLNDDGDDFSCQRCECRRWVPDVEV